MALYGHLQLFSILLGTFLTFCPHLYECKKLDGYEFPVYSTESCPRNQTEWNERSSAINCTQDNGYLCFPNEKLTQLLEFCHNARFIWIQEGYCLYLNKDDSTIYSYSCRSFQSGCHNASFPSYDLFKHSSCTSIGNGCFLAEPSCRGPDTTTSLRETTKPIHVEIVTRNYITTVSTGERTNQTLKHKDSVNYDERSMMPTLLGVLLGILIFIALFCMLCFKYRKGVRKNDEEQPTAFKEEHVPLIPTDDHYESAPNVEEISPEIDTGNIEAKREPENGCALVTNNNSFTAAQVQVCKIKKCCGDAEFYCFTCEREMCLSCKEDHVNILNEEEHRVEISRAKINSRSIDEYCAMHPKIYRMYCKFCKVPSCPECKIHKKHSEKDITEEYISKRKQTIGTVMSKGRDALFYRKALLPGIKPDFKTCHRKFSLYQSNMLVKAKTLKHIINYMAYNFMWNVLCDFDFKHRCLKQKIEMVIHIVRIQGYEHRYEQPAYTFSALQFLSSIKTALPQMHVTLHTSQLSMTESLNKEDVMELLSAIQITERGVRQVAMDRLMMPAPELYKSFQVMNITRCYHISIVKSDQVCVNDSNKLILIKDFGKRQHTLEANVNAEYARGIHAVSSKNKLYFIDKEDNINQLSDDMKIPTTIVKKTDDIGKPLSLCISLLTGDLLVGMLGKVARYKHTGELKQIIHEDSDGNELFVKPVFITENNNGDIVVSDYYNCAVIVTNMRGEHRFSYKGPPSSSGLNPVGICTDSLSHILVCDYTNKTVQLLDRDGQFLQYLLKDLDTNSKLCSLSYDANTDYLWVGSDDNTVWVYKYITKQAAYCYKNV